MTYSFTLTENEKYQHIGRQNYCRRTQHEKIFSDFVLSLTQLQETNNYRDRPAEHQTVNILRQKIVDFCIFLLDEAIRSECQVNGNGKYFHQLPEILGPQIIFQTQCTVASEHKNLVWVRFL